MVKNQNLRRNPQNPRNYADADLNTNVKMHQFLDCFS